LRRHHIAAARVMTSGSSDHCLCVVLTVVLRLCCTVLCVCAHVACSFVESGPATSATPPRSHPLFPAASSRQRPHSTPLRSMSHLPVHERLYGARVMHKKERRLERSFSRRDNMRAAALSEQQQAQGKALMATINRILTAKFGSSTHTPPHDVLCVCVLCVVRGY